ncbi:MAG: flavin reductase family protein, partial [Ignavibacterium sp.]
MKSILPKELSVPEVQRLLQGGIGPRPIALVSTISKNGANNLTPFSFFNVFGANPPVIAFSPSRRGKDGSLKDTYLNLMDTKECVVNAVTYSMVEQISLASTEYEYGIDEFVKSGLTPIGSDLVKPKRVKESPFQMECKLLEMRS